MNILQKSSFIWSLIMTISMEIFSFIFYAEYAEFATNKIILYIIILLLKFLLFFGLAEVYKKYVPTNDF